MIPFTELTRAIPVSKSVRAFPTEGTNLARILFDAPYRQTFHARLKKYNPLVVVLYRIGLLPLLGVGRTVLLLTTKGRKSGKRRSTPVGYFRIGGVMHVFSAWGKSSSWYKNLLANPEEVSVQVGMRQRVVRARALEEPAKIQGTLEQFVTESPAQARYLLGWEPDRDRIDQADFSTVIQRVLIVRIEDVPA